MAYGYYSPQYPGFGNMTGYQAQPQPQQSAQQSIIWVQGESGAKSYLMAPGSTALLMDSESNRMYIKSTDAAGMPTLRAYEYTEVSQQTAPQITDTAKYATVDDLTAIRQKVEELSEWMEKSRTRAKKATQTEGEA